MEQFLNKYTRFMTKDIYISNKMYTNFLSAYRYLYEELGEQAFLYEQEEHYKKVIELEQNKTPLLRLHNQKYLKKMLSRYQIFFDAIYSKDILDSKMRKLILCEEDKMLVVGQRRLIPLIVGKIKYLVDILHYSEDGILILAEDEDILEELKKELINKGLYHVLAISIMGQGKLLLKSHEKLVGYEEMYRILSEYLMKKLFPNKEQFDQLYFAFRDNIYLNRDYQDYETFKDYHSYMYKRKFLATKLSLKDYNKQEIMKRKTYLRTILNETVDKKEEVDIANFLYLNSLEYHYDKVKSCFYIQRDQEDIQIQYLKVEEPKAIPKDKRVIYLYSCYWDHTSYLEKLVYELIKRRLPLEKRSEEEIYRVLRDTTMDSYFHEFITKCFMPAYEHYQKYGNLSGTKLTDFQIQKMVELCTYYQEYLEKHCLISQKEMCERIEKNLNNKYHEYVFLIGDVPILPKIQFMKLIKDYPKQELLKGNVQLLYDYRKYLSLKRTLPVVHAYLDEQELNTLTETFLKENLEIVNQGLRECVKKIIVYFYDDQNRLLLDKNRINCLDGIFCEVPNEEKILLAFRSLRDLPKVLEKPFFSKVDRKTVITKDKRKVDCAEIFSISKNYDTIFLPYLIMDRYHDEFFLRDYLCIVKLMLYVVLHRCRKGIFILCPVSKREEIYGLLSCFQNVSFLFSKGCIK